VGKCYVAFVHQLLMSWQLIERLTLSRNVGSSYAPTHASCHTEWCQWWSTKDV